MKLIILFIAKYILGYLLQDLSFILGIYAFSKEKIKKKAFFISAGVIIPVNILIRMLPISYGINMLISIATILYVNYRLCPAELYTIIQSTLITMFLVLVSEIMCFVSLYIGFGKVRCDEFLKDPFWKAVLYVPFNMALSLYMFYRYRKMVKEYY
ncbi:MAG: hypothetical protein E7256_02805 [Lachnospiraceae bacterium]|nr:hypothetical protein [Lachnospiraceae bacterium]